MSATAFVEKIRNDPLAFGRDVLQRTRWSGLEEMRLAIARNRFLHVRSGHSVGKTFELAGAVCEAMATMPGTRVICTGPTYNQVKDGIWSEVRKAALKHPYLARTRPGVDGWKVEEGWDARIASVDNISAIQGGRGERCIIIIDEAQGVDDYQLWTALLSLMTSSDSRMIASGNPLFPQGNFYQLMRDPSWVKLRINGRHHPNVVSGEEVIKGAITTGWIAEMEKKFGVGSPEVTARVDGEFPESGTSQVVTISELDACADIVPPVVERRRMGLDVAREGGDRTVATVLGENRQVIHVEAWGQCDLMETVGRAAALAQQWHIPTQGGIKVDVCGLGAGVADRLVEIGWAVDRVDFGSGPQGDWSDLIGDEVKVKNRRAELHFALRLLARGKLIGIGAQYQDTIADLLAPTFAYASDAKLKVKDKQEIKREIGRSPDFGDSLIIALSNGSSGVEFSWT